MGGRVSQLGPTSLRIFASLQQAILLLDTSQTAFYLDEEFLSKASIIKEDWRLDDTDEFFECMTQEAFSNLQPDEPVAPYEQVKPPNRGPPGDNIFDLEYSARDIEAWFYKLSRVTVSDDDLSSWGQRELTKYEYALYQGCRRPPAVHWMLCRAMCNGSGKPHQVYHVWNGDEGREGQIPRSELDIVLRTMRGRMIEASFSRHIVPILLLSIHGCKARILIAHPDRFTSRLRIKCSKFEQFDGFTDQTRPIDFDAKKDLFFRWSNPVCRKGAELEDSQDAPKMVLRGPKRRKRLVLQNTSPDITNVDTPQSSN